MNKEKRNSLVFHLVILAIFVSFYIYTLYAIEENTPEAWGVDAYFLKFSLIGYGVFLGVPFFICAAVTREKSKIYYLTLLPAILGAIVLCVVGLINITNAAGV